ncbi:MAG TPA: TIGR03619 family F420-dependent LLM class oxidoreductase [Streptosporangiaceae bacterium]|nr:TIGR03619 family F420-dependent LLM class oxidoreductase [Streptosporangiaceae bacterium]
MKIGFGAPVSGAWASPANLTSFAARAEQAGYHSLWTFQRLLVPVDSQMEPVYQSVLDPVAALGYLAAVTSRIRLGIAVLNLPYLSPALVAKQAATLDVLSGGRLDLGLGAGWMPEEFQAAGASLDHRGARATEYIAALRALWVNQVSQFNGEFYTIPIARVNPKPVQPGGPPILLGGSVPAALRRAGRIADGWVTSSRTNLSRIGEGVDAVRSAARDAGRDPAAVRVVCRGVVRAGVEATGSHGQRLLLSGSYDQIRADTAWLAERGVTELFYDLNWDPEIGSPDASPATATQRAGEILEALAPTRS